MTTTTSFNLEMANAALDAATDEFHNVLTVYNDAADAMIAATETLKAAQAAVAREKSLSSASLQNEL